MDQKKKYKRPPYKGRYQFDRVAILKDFKTLKEFKETYDVFSLTFLRGVANIENLGIPRKYFIDTQEIKSRIYACEGVVFTKNQCEATHILKILNGKVVFEEVKND